MRLDDSDWAILRTLFRSTGEAPRGPLRVPLNDLCRASGLHPNSVARRLGALRQAGILGGTYFDPWPAMLGLARGGFTFEGTSVRGMRAVAEAVADFPMVETVISAHGVVMGHLWADSGNEVDRTIAGLGRAVGTQRTLVGYNTARWPPKPPDRLPLTSLDRRIILALRGSEHRSTASIARGLGVSQRTLQRRAARLVTSGAGNMRPRFHPGAIEGAVLVDFYAVEGDQRSVPSLANAFPDRLLGPFGVPACVFVPLASLQEAERRRAAAKALPGLGRLETYLVEDVLQPPGFEEWLAPRVANPPSAGEKAVRYPPGLEV